MCANTCPGKVTSPSILSIREKASAIRFHSSGRCLESDPNSSSSHSNVVFG